MTDTRPASERATFTRMDESTEADWQVITGQMHHLTDALPDRILEQLQLLENDYGGFIVDRLTHSLQTAARAEADDRDDEYIVCALLHDVGDVLGPLDHPAIGAAILKPWVSEANHWMVAEHGVFQGYYFWHHLGGDRDAREQHRGHEFFDRTEEFCALYDMPAFDPTYPTPSLEHYEPLLREYFQPRSFI